MAKAKKDVTRRKFIKGGKASSILGAAALVVADAAGGGTEESKKSRLVKRYIANFGD